MWPYPLIDRDDQLFRHICYKLGAFDTLRKLFRLRKYPLISSGGSPSAPILHDSHNAGGLRIRVEDRNSLRGNSTRIAWS
jgi:hypothetical protein